MLQGTAVTGKTTIRGVLTSRRARREFSAAMFDSLYLHASCDESK